MFIASAVLLDKYCKHNIRCKDRVMPSITGTSLTQIQHEVVPTDPVLLFHRICVTKQSEEN